MPFFQLDDSSLVPFQRQAISSGVYEEEIEELMWDNLEELTGENLFRGGPSACPPARETRRHPVGVAAHR